MQTEPPVVGLLQKFGFDGAKKPAVCKLPPPVNVMVPFERIEQPGIEMVFEPVPAIWPLVDRASRHGCVAAALPGSGAEVVVTTSAVPLTVIVCDELPLNNGDDR